MAFCHVYTEYCYSVLGILLGVVVAAGTMVVLYLFSVAATDIWLFLEAKTIHTVDVRYLRDTFDNVQICY